MVIGDPQFFDGQKANPSAGSLDFDDPKEFEDPKS